MGRSFASLLNRNALKWTGKYHLTVSREFKICFMLEEDKLYRANFPDDLIQYVGVIRTDAGPARVSVSQLPC